MTLAAAGSRRTVYLIDENSKLPDSTTSTTQTTDTDLLAINNNRNTSTPNPTCNHNFDSKTNNNNHTTTSSEQIPSTFLMYNRISNVIGDPNVIGNGSNSQNLSRNSVNDAKDKKRSDEEKAIWYEYGCV